jgi:hypothetical protein
MVGEDADRDSALHQRIKGDGAIISIHVSENRAMRPPTQAGAGAECRVRVSEIGKVLQGFHRDGTETHIQ